MKVLRLRTKQQALELVQLRVLQAQGPPGWAKSIVAGGQVNIARFAVLLKGMESLALRISKKSGTRFARPRQAVPSLPDCLTSTMICSTLMSANTLGGRNIGIASIVGLASGKHSEI